jgi:5-dehydro-2-deoxygluconokinase
VNADASAPDAVVVGRVGADLYPEQLRRHLSEIETFRRFVGGFAGNVAIALARLGVGCAIVSAVGDDGHGEYVRRTLEAEGVDCRWLSVHPSLRTALAFCEAWPPDHFPITFYRTPTCPDWELSVTDLDLDAIGAAPLVYATGTGLAREPSRTATLAVLERSGAGPGLTIFDADWRPALWDEPAEYRVLAPLAAGRADIVIGGDAELAAAGLGPDAAATVVAKHGAAGATLYEDGGRTNFPGRHVKVMNGLGAGDAFAAAFGAALLAGRSVRAAAAEGNAAGAIVATRLACSDAMPTRAEVDALMEEPAGA